MDDEALAWATRCDAGALSLADQSALDAWLASDPAHSWRLAHYRQFYAQLHGTVPAMAAVGWLPEKNAPARRKSRRGRWTALAGAAAVVALATVFWWQAPQHFATETAHRQSVTLADGSRVDLNARTRLSVSLYRGSRHVRLERGEAFFAVAKDPARPFFVETAAGSVRVTGTVFDVRAVTETAPLEVTVIEGSVAVQPIDDHGRELPAPPALTAGDRLVFDPATGAVERSHPASVEDVAAWREGKVVFAGTPLAEAAERFAEYHGQTIVIAPEVAGLPLGGRYTLDDLDRFMAALERALPVRVLRRADGGWRVIAASQPR